MIYHLARANVRHCAVPLINLVSAAGGDVSGVGVHCTLTFSLIRSSRTRCRRRIAVVVVVVVVVSVVSHVRESTFCVCGCTQCCVGGGGGVRFLSDVPTVTPSSAKVLMKCGVYIVSVLKRLNNMAHDGI